MPEAPALTVPGADASPDRFLATCVSDLLSESDARALIDEADRLLAPGCALAPVSLTHGTTLASRIACLPQRGSGALTGLVGRPTKVGDLLKPRK